MQFAASYSFIPACRLAVHFHPAHLKNLRVSGLTDDTIRAAGVYSLAPRFIDFFFKAGSPAEIKSALCFPYQGGAFARIKLFPALGGMKYSQPPGTSARLYVPFAVSAGPVIIAEGEKKTLAACQAGFNAAGIGGLWNWLSNGEPIVDLNAMEWNSREVTIIPDSDVFQRIDLLRAVYALGREIQSRGANVLVAQIPQTGAAKVGLDDYLVADGRVDSLDVFSLSHRIFKSAAAWHLRWKFQKIRRAAA